MAITVKCSCGKQLRVGDDYAGKRVKCPGCGKPVSVPVDDDDQPVSASAYIRFECECGKQLQVQAEYAGKMTRCPACGEKQEIPDADEAERREAKSRIRAERPAPKKALSRPDEEDEPDEERDDRPIRAKRSKKIKKQKSAMPFMILGGLALLLVLGGGGFASYWFFFRGGENMSEHAFIPPDAMGFVSMRLPELANSDIMMKGMRTPDGREMLTVMASDLGVAKSDLERLTGVIQDAEGNITWAVLTTTKSLDRNSIIKRMKNHKAITHEGKTYHATTTAKIRPVPMMPGGGLMPGGKGAASAQEYYFFAGPKLLVVTENEAAMKQAISAALRKSATGLLADAIKQIPSQRHIYASFVLPATLTQQLQAQKAQLPLQAKAAGPLMDLTGVTMSMDVGETFTIDAALKFPDEAKAKAALNSFTALKGMFEVFVLPMLQDKPTADAMKSSMEKMKSEARGSELVVKFDVPKQAITTLQQMGGMPR